MPLLVTALERAMQLAESMEARGFGGQIDTVTDRRRLLGQLSMLVGLGLLGGGFAGVGFWPDRQLLVGVLLLVGTIAVLAAFWDQGRRVHRSRYRRWQWRRADRALMLISIVVAAGWAVAWLARGDWLFFYPYPPYTSWPSFHPELGALILLLALPGLMLPPPVLATPPQAA
jgi:energy-coupling factor transport system permease protein